MLKPLQKKGFVTLAFDPSYTGESGGTPRHVASPDINTEDFSAAVDYLSNLSYVNPEKIGVLGICGFGGFAINAAAMDTRIKAAVASTMYDMTRVNAKGYFDAEDSAEARYAKRQALNAQRTLDYQKANTPWAAVWLTLCRTMRLFTSRTIMTITKPAAAIMRAR